MDEVLWHSATCRFSKSILVKIPRLPTIRVIGSQFMSTSLRDFPALPDCDVGAMVVAMAVSFTVSGPGGIARGQLTPGVPPLRFFIEFPVGICSERPNDASVKGDADGRDVCAGRLIHEGHELVGEPRHRAADADATDVGTAADAGHPSPFRHVAIHHGTPAAQLHQTFG